MPSVCLIGFAAVTHKQNCVVCGKEFTPKRSDAVTHSPKCRQQLSRANRGKDPAVIAKKQHIKELKHKRKHSPRFLKLMDEYFTRMRRDAAETTFGGTVNISTRAYRHDKSTKTAAELRRNTREVVRDGRAIREVFTFGGTGDGKRKSHGAPRPTVRYGVLKPKASDIPLYEFEDDEALAQAGFIAFLMKIARRQKRKLSKKRLKQIARQKAAAVEAAERAAEYEAEVAEDVSEFPISLPTLPEKFTVGIVAHEVELCADDCGGIGCDCGCHEFRETVVEQ